MCRFSWVCLVCVACAWVAQNGRLQRRLWLYNLETAIPDVPAKKELGLTWCNRVSTCNVSVRNKETSYWRKLAENLIDPCYSSCSFYLFCEVRPILIPVVLRYGWRDHEIHVCITWWTILAQEKVIKLINGRLCIDRCLWLTRDPKKIRCLSLPVLFL